MNLWTRWRNGSTAERVVRTTESLLSEKGESNARSMAMKLIAQFEGLDAEGQLQVFDRWASLLSPDPALVMEAARNYQDHPDADRLLALFRTVEPARQELFRRINRAPGGTEAIVRMRERLLKHLSARPQLQAVDADLEHLLSSWFNPGFLELHEITWSSPALLLEKIIAHESVHAIDGWDDLRRRLQPDRRCFAFFHPQLPNEPLIFVEVALLPAIPAAVGPLLDKRSQPLDAKQFKAAIFYSISNCQPGLRGVSMGNFLIKRVADRIADEIPTVKTFCTLSPIPGFMRWVATGAPVDAEVSPARRRKIDAVRERLGVGDSPMPAHAPATPPAEAQRDDWLALCFIYLTQVVHQRHGDPVARFHLSNGATLHGIHWDADRSGKGRQQSAGMMVNYLYELDKVEGHHEAFVNRQVVYSKRLDKLLG